MSHYHRAVQIAQTAKNRLYAQRKIAELRSRAHIDLLRQGEQQSHAEMTTALRLLHTPDPDRIWAVQKLQDLVCDALGIPRPPKRAKFDAFDLDDDLPF